MIVSSTQAINAMKNYPVSKWEAWVDGMTSEQREAYITALEEIAIRAAWMTGYLNSRYGSGCGDQGHPQAVKDSNKVRAMVRKAFGYDVTRQVSF